MKSIIAQGFDPDKRFNVDELHTEVLRQFHIYRKQSREGIPEFAVDKQQRETYLSKWVYIHDRFATYLSKLSQETISGSKLTEKLNTIKSQGEDHNWKLRNYHEANTNRSSPTSKEQNKIDEYV